LPIADYGADNNNPQKLLSMSRQMRLSRRTGYGRVGRRQHGLAVCFSFDTTATHGLPDRGSFLFSARDSGQAQTKKMLTNSGTMEIN
jgi:hypothetical protein